MMPVSPVPPGDATTATADDDDKASLVAKEGVQVAPLTVASSAATSAWSCKRCSTPVSEQRDFHAYQLSLFIVTQLGYLPMAGSMLATTFFEPDPRECNVAEPAFHSLLVEWRQHCRQSTWPIVISSMVMFGAVVGAFGSGFLADRFGRKPVVVGSMILVCVGNALLAGGGGLSPVLAALLFGLLGAACGGYMVTNLVLMVENLAQARSRLLVVSLNGWPLGMVFVAIVGFLSRDWRTYHSSVASVAAMLFIILQCTSLESVRWLILRNKLLRADKVQSQIDSRNTRVNDILPLAMRAVEMRDSSPQLMSPTKSALRRKPSYLDLFRHSSVRRPLLALVYCFTVSSVVSFGFYFSVEVLPGSRYANLALMGLLKFGLGFLPYLVSFWVGRKLIIASSVGVAAISAWLYFAVSFGLGATNHWLITVLGLLVTASMDPTWKINHLYSAELFPTSVRNMARAVCNVGARLGSLAAPAIVFSRHWFTEAPILLFAALLTVQWLVVLVYLPETRDADLSDDIELSEREKSPIPKENENTAFTIA